METIIVVIILAIVWAAIGSVQTIKYWYSLCLNACFTIAFYVLVDNFVVKVPYIENISFLSLSIFLFVVAFLFGLMSRVDLMVTEKTKEKTKDEKNSFKREKWNAYMLLIFWFSWALILALFIRLNLYGPLVALLSIITAIILFLTWLVFEKKRIVLYSVSMTIVSLVGFALLIF